MCTIPPAPPPPPPPSPGASLPISESSSHCSMLNRYDLCEWASSEPHLRDACIKNNICVNQIPYMFAYKHYESIIQIGPTCGLVALSMLLKNAISPESLLNLTKAEGYSNNGEMFSCKDMAKLAKKAVDLLNLENIEISVQGGLNTTQTIEALLNGTVLMVAYDADCNHSPCLRNGHTAHWALVSGIIIVKQDDSDPNNVYVLCKHGKSKYVSVWTLDILNRSNQNLTEFSPKKKNDGLTYILPEGGIGGVNGLRGQILMFNGL